MRLIAINFCTALVETQR